MTLLNTRAVGLRQAAAFVESVCDRLRQVANRQPDSGDRLLTTIKASELDIVKMGLDRLAQEAESDERNDS